MPYGVLDPSAVPYSARVPSSLGAQSRFSTVGATPKHHVALRLTEPSVYGTAFDT